MGEEIFKILSQAGSAAIVGLMFIVYMYFDSKKKAQTLIIKDDERSKETTDVADELQYKEAKGNERLIKLEILFSEHCKVQGESFATIHNGLNSNANAVKDLTKALTEYNTRLAVLTALFEERLPKK